jgi:S-adenosylmethionine-diacylglycerol 3-amino-3-carboxypropyl transferase
MSHHPAPAAPVTGRAATPRLDPPSSPRLHFTETWEDPRIDSRALAIEPGDRVIAITAGGCTPLSLLTEAPVTMTTVDYNPAQSHLFEIKAAALGRFPVERVDAFLRRGEATSGPCYEALRPELGSAARAFWDKRRRLLARGVAASGVATRIFYRIGRFLRRAFKPALLEELFDCESLPAQERFYRENLDFPRVRGLTSLIGPLASRPWVLSQLFRADYFPHATERNIPAFLWRRIEHVLTRVAVGDNYFLSRILLDRDLETPAGRPPYLRPEGLAQLRDNLGRLEVVTAPIEDYLGGLATSSVDKLQLTNVFEWMPAALVPAVFAQIARVGRPGARVCFRNLFTERSVPPSLRDLLQTDEQLSAELLDADRSLIYSRCCALRILK